MAMMMTENEIKALAHRIATGEGESKEIATTTTALVEGAILEHMEEMPLDSMSNKDAFLHLAGDAEMLTLPPIAILTRALDSEYSVIAPEDQRKANKTIGQLWRNRHARVKFAVKKAAERLAECTTSTHRFEFDGKGGFRLEPKDAELKEKLEFDEALKAFRKNPISRELLVEMQVAADAWNEAARAKATAEFEAAMA